MKNKYLGKRAKDRITGFEGVITAYAEYLTDTPRILLEDVDSTGRPVEFWVQTVRADVEE